ncbi:MAG: hypothetical protein LN546_04245, partial [Rickettsia endosymbiont of Ecitomorpha arachnoides]|nr:hypothetical protein [Rickettsia endosymbiont of Ecitomorpha arachnoides]
FIQYFYFHYLLQYYHYSLPPYSEDITLILYQFLSVALYHFTSVANKVSYIPLPEFCFSIFFLCPSIAFASPSLFLSLS